ncbi:MAG: RagB/SusD family nutrient uptake outer membrane protein [Flammeovirgaceae bacterium]|nr:RagB/SusD family nutrient uptake outer membrane protein [Flammeovirgaceae bacterium]
MKKFDYSPMKLYSNKYISHFTLLIILLTSVSCDDYLDEIPDNRVALDNLDKASQLLTNAYPVASYAFTDWMTDDVNFTRGTSLRTEYEQIYSWEEVTVDPNNQDTPVFYWYNAYESVAHANEVLVALETLPAKTEDELARKSAVESEALLTRAYAHFMLVNLFAKHYDAESAKSDMGIPYVEEPETVFLKTYTRNSVEEVYDKIERDMLKGIEQVNESLFENSGKYHFNRNAALAFASRFYLFKGDYVKCEEYSNKLLGSSATSFVRDFNSEEYRNASSSIDDYPRLYSSPDEKANLLLIRKISNFHRTFESYGPTEELYGDLFNNRPFTNTDQRENPAFVKGDNALFPVRYESLFERSSINSSFGLPYHIAIGFRGEEVLLNRAESYVLQGKFSLALADLQTLVKKRYLGRPDLDMETLRSFYGVPTSDSSLDRILLFLYVQLERRKEFIMQGIRWFELKRLTKVRDLIGINPQFFSTTVTHDLNIDGSATITLEEDDLRKVILLPASAVDVGGLKQNER